MLKVVSDDINKFELQRFVSPNLTEMCRRLSFSLCYAINRMVDRYARQKCMTDRTSICVKVIERRVYNQL
jgi:hypothetical protein